MTEAKQNLDAKIAGLIKVSTPYRSIARRLFLYDFTVVFVTDPDRGFGILNAICEHFGLPFSAVKIVGSAQTGYSYYSERDFLAGTSDLDIAIISPTLFLHYSEETYSMTRGYSNQSNFPRLQGLNAVRSFRDYLSEGYFRPDLMPYSNLRTKWFGFFNRLSNKHTALFSNINAGIYLSEAFFEMKNSAIVDAYGKAKE